MSELTEARAAAAAAREEYENGPGDGSAQLFDATVSDCSKLWRIAAIYWASASKIGQLGDTETQAQFAGWAQDAEDAAQSCEDAGGEIIELG